MTYTAEQATDAIANLDLDRLSPKQIEEALKSIINQLDTTPLNTTNSATTVLYSGASVDDIVDNPDFRLLNNTEAYSFLNDVKNNKPLINALEKIHGIEPDFDKWTSQAGIFIGGDDRVMPRDKGAWDTISANFVHGAEGNVITNIGENAGANRVFLQTELPAIRENPNITHIDGIEKQTLFNKLNFVNLNNLSYNNHKKTA